ncbi:hypothetical protein [Paenarthrobacter aromaticivorans]|uniref:hypothetical protein n=1 Tax=Paenarthrobacter aromaticivorans TaxID=2849150 RepID=UPI003A7FFF7C
MTLSLVFITVGLAKVLLRKRIARRQYFIAARMLGWGADDLDDDRARAFEKFGTFFCSLLILAGVIILVLTLVFRPPWAGA